MFTSGMVTAVISVLMCALALLMNSKTESNAFSKFGLHTESYVSLMWAFRLTLSLSTPASFSSSITFLSLFMRYA